MPFLCTRSYLILKNYYVHWILIHYYYEMCVFRFTKSDQSGFHLLCIMCDTLPFNLTTPTRDNYSFQVCIKLFYFAYAYSSTVETLFVKRTLNNNNLSVVISDLFISCTHKNLLKICHIILILYYHTRISMQLKRHRHNASQKRFRIRIMYVKDCTPMRT